MENKILPLVSVIIPCYNQGRYVDEAIKSVLSSSYQHIEIIVVNDGSSDIFTNEILNKKKWDKTIVYNKQNGGLSDARNFGIKKSSGVYVLPLDADDKISSTYIEKAMNAFITNPENKVVCCEVKCFGKSRKVIKFPRYTIETLICRNTMVCSSFFRRSDFDKTNGYNSNMKYGYEDWDFWLSILENGGSVYRIPEVHFYYRIKKKSMLNSLRNSSEKISFSRKQIYVNHLNLYSKVFFDPLKSIEYCSIFESKEYKLGDIILKPIRYIYNFL